MRRSDVHVVAAWLVLALVAIVPAVALAAEVATDQPDTGAIGMFGGGATIGAGLLYVGRVIAQLGRKLIARLDADEAYRTRSLQHYEREEGALGEILRAVAPEHVPDGARITELERLMAEVRQHAGMAGPVAVREGPSSPIRLR